MNDKPEQKEISQKSLKRLTFEIAIALFVIGVISAWILSAFKVQTTNLYQDALYAVVAVLFGFGITDKTGGDIMPFFGKFIPPRFRGGFNGQNTGNI